MAISVVLFPRNSRSNSTKYPTNGEGFPCEITEGCDILNPRIKLFLSDSYDLGNVGIFFIPQWSRYYDVTSIEYIDGFWWISGEVNVLISNRSQIASTKFLFERTSDPAAPWGYLSDNFYPLQANPDCYTLYSETYPLVTKLDSGTWVVGISGSAGVSNYYAFSNGLFRQFTNLMFSKTDWMSIVQGKDFDENMAKLFINPMQYITSAFWLPISYDNVPGCIDANSIKLGFWSFSTACKHFRGNPIYSFTINLSVLIKDHPDIKQGLYYNLSPYREVVVYWYPFGVIPLECGRRFSSGLDGDKLVGHVQIDCNTGHALLKIRNDNDIFYWGTADMGVSVPLSGTTSNIGNAMTGMLDGAIKTVTGDKVGGIMETVASASSMLTENKHNFGTAGSVLAIGEPPNVVTRCYKPVSTAFDEFGFPSGRYGTVTKDKGYYYKCVKPNCRAKTKIETDRLNNLLEEGFYFE